MCQSQGIYFVLNSGVNLLQASTWSMWPTDFRTSKCHVIVFLTAEPLVKEPSHEEMEKAICNLKTNKAPGEDDIIAELFKNTSRELKKGFMH